VGPAPPTARDELPTQKPLTQDCLEKGVASLKKLILGSPLESYCSCNDPMSRVIRYSRAYCRVRHAAATQALGGSGFAWAKRKTAVQAAGLGLCVEEST